MKPPHPGEILRDDYLVPLGRSAGWLARAIKVPRTRIERIANEEISISADTALRLARALGTTPELWMSLQSTYDLWVAAQSTDLEAIEPIHTK